MTETVPTTPGEFLSHDLLTRDEIHWGDDRLYPSAWTEGLKQQFRDTSEALAQRARQMRTDRDPIFNNYNTIHTWLLDDMYPTGDLHVVIQWYPEVMARWLYPALDRLDGWTPPAAPTVDVVAPDAPFQVGERLVVTVPNTNGIGYQIGDIVEVVRLSRNDTAVLTRTVRSDRYPVGSEWYLYPSSLARITEDAPAPAMRPVRKDELVAGMTLTVASTRSSSTMFSIGDTVTVSDPLSTSSGDSWDEWVRVSGTRTAGSSIGTAVHASSWYISDFTVPNVPVDEVARLTAEVARLQAIIDAVQSAIAPF